LALAVANVAIPPPAWNSTHGVDSRACEMSAGKRALSGAHCLLHPMQITTHLPTIALARACAQTSKATPLAAHSPCSRRPCLTPSVHLPLVRHAGAVLRAAGHAQHALARQCGDGLRGEAVLDGAQPQLPVLVAPGGSEWGEKAVRGVCECGGVGLWEVDCSKERSILPAGNAQEVQGKDDNQPASPAQPSSLPTSPPAKKGSPKAEQLSRVGGHQGVCVPAGHADHRLAGQGGQGEGDEHVPAVAGALQRNNSGVDKVRSVRLRCSWGCGCAGAGAEKYYWAQSSLFCARKDDHSPSAASSTTQQPTAVLAVQQPSLQQPGNSPASPALATEQLGVHASRPPAQQACGPQTRAAVASPAPMPQGS